MTVTRLIETLAAEEVGERQLNTMNPVIASRAMEKYRVGQTVTVKLSGGSIVEAEIKAIRETTDGFRLNIGFGNEAAQIYEWQIVESK